PARHAAHVLPGPSCFPPARVRAPTIIIARSWHDNELSIFTRRRVPGAEARGGAVEYADTAPRETAMPEPQLVRPLLLSIAAALVTMGLKTFAYFLTGSVGLLSDAAESGINLLTALVAYVSLWYASLPVDRSHAYGHEKIEYFSSGLEGILILCAAASIAGYAIYRLIVPAPLES